MKKFFLFLLLVFVNISVYSEIIEVDGIQYDIIRKGRIASVHNSGVTWKGGNAEIPSSIVWNDTIFDVVAIDEYAFSPGGVEVKYGRIKLPPTIKRIDNNAFYHCKIDSLFIADLKSWCEISFEVHFPSSYDAVPFYHTEHFFVNEEEIIDLIIPEGTTQISDYAFWGCKMESVTIPASITSIGEESFAYCRKLNKVITKDIAAWCTISFSSLYSNPLSFNSSDLYSENNKITELVIPEGVSNIGKYAFTGCNSLTTVTIPNSITSIGEYAFSACANLTMINIPDKISSIERGVFWGCTNLTDITIPNSATSIGESAFGNCSGLITIDIPDNIKTIGREAFYNCNHLKTINVGCSVSKIYDMAFASCSELEAIYLYPTQIPTAYDNIFQDSYADYIALYVPQSLIDVYQQTFPWSSCKQVSALPQIIYIVDGEFYKSVTTKIGEVIVPEAAPSKEGYTFSGWSEIPEKMPAHDVTVTGTFSINEYKLTYKVDGEVYKTYDVKFGATITPEKEPTKEGYTFSGWNEIPATMPAHDVTITGAFSVNKYKLTYNVDGEVYKSFDVEYGAAITPEAEPTKEGYTFSGWSTVPETMPAHDVIVIGSFSKGQYKLVYIVDGQTYKTISYDYGEAITPEPAPKKDGYTFSGWSEIPATMPAHDVTVTGTFSINKYKLTYKVDDEVYKTFDVEYGTTITPETEPTKEGYTFSGWSEIPITMPAHDVTVTGTFTLDTGIDLIMSSENGNAMIFTIDGKRVDNLKKGMNVIRMKDGTTRKVVVK